MPDATFVTMRYGFGADRRGIQQFQTVVTDANGKQLGWDHDKNGTRRNIVWDDENRIQSVFDNGHEKSYQYDDQGERVIKRGPQGETAYVNQWFTVRNREVASKHVFIGTTRIATSVVPGVTPAGAVLGAAPVLGPDAPIGIVRGIGIANRSAQAAQHARNLLKNPHYAGGLVGAPSSGPGTATNQDNFLYYYHPDHLGSSSYVSDALGKPFEHLEYFPFGETWVEESSNTQRTPYLFTAKELDEETGLYYFGARYYDPRTSVWQSPDQILAKYLPRANRTNQNKNLSGMGGVFNPLNLGLYSYGYLNPVKFSDPDGNESYAIGGKIHIVPEGGQAPSVFGLPNTVGAEGFCGCNPLLHTYKVTTPTSIPFSEGAKAVGGAIRNNPTPGKDQPASPAGTLNDVGQLPTMGKKNFVKSFNIASPDPSKYTDITINYTAGFLEHGADEGFVMRYGEKGANGTINLISYGEGEAFRQNHAFENLFGLGWGPAVEKVWQQNHQEIVKDVMGKANE